MGRPIMPYPYLQTWGELEMKQETCRNHKPSGLALRRSAARFGITRTATQLRGKLLQRAVTCVRTKCCLLADTTPAAWKLTKTTTSSWSSRLMPPDMLARLFSNHGIRLAVRTALVSVSCSGPQQKVPNPKPSPSHHRFFEVPGETSR